MPFNGPEAVLALARARSSSTAVKACDLAVPLADRLQRLLYGPPLGPQLVFRPKLDRVHHRRHLLHATKILEHRRDSFSSIFKSTTFMNPDKSSLADHVSPGPR